MSLCLKRFNLSEIVGDVTLVGLTELKEIPSRCISVYK